MQRWADVKIEIMMYFAQQRLSNSKVSFQTDKATYTDIFRFYKIMQDSNGTGFQVLTRAAQAIPTAEKGNSCFGVTKTRVRAM